MRIASLTLDDTPVDLSPMSPSGQELSAASLPPTPISLDPDLIERLLKFYFERHAEYFPVIDKDIFITSKLWNTDHPNAAAGLEKTLKALGTDYLDLYVCLIVVIPR